MIWLFRGIYLLEFLLVGLTGIQIYREKKSDAKYVLAIAVLSLVMIAAGFLQLVDLKNTGSLSAWNMICSQIPAVLELCSASILFLTVLYIIRQLKFTSKFISTAVIIFIAYGIFDSGAIIFNFYLHHSFSTSILPMWAADDAPWNFVITVEGLIFYHHLFFLSMSLLIFFALLLKCSTLPFAYAGKYYMTGFFVVVSAILNSVFYQNSKFSFKLHYPMMFLALLPVLLYWRFYHYRPSFMLSYIRQMVFDKLGSPVVLFDINDHLIDFNMDAASSFALEKVAIDHLTLDDFLMRTTGKQVRKKSSSTVEEVTIELPNDKRVYKMDYTCLTDKYGKGLGTLLIYHDITQLKELYDTMERTAMTDVLTGLASGTFLKKKITEINLYRKFPYSAVVCELNGLSLIQEGFGEDAAKAAVMHVAEVLRKQLRASDFASYSDGNMIILMPDTDVVMAEKVIKRVAEKLEKDTTFNFMLSFEYGISSRPTRDSDMNLTVSQAAASLAKNKVVKSAYVHDSIIESLQKTLRSSSFETEQHSIRVQNLSVKIAEKLKLDDKEIDNLKLLALFHDIGKLSVPQEILLKPGELTEEERQVMILHTINGFKIANCSEELSLIARGILCHHENWDGTGYPNGYKGEEIPYLARIVSVADNFDVMTHDRSYAKAVSAEAAKGIILAGSGSKFDPKIVKAFDSISLEMLAEKFL